ncbi:MAG: hypothetical protein HBSAPP03_19590 [Phycisphaerae bacterium]|nr:MAG: hypothetical protein HBSAPP03_19590 [Phycisphaerae bacterium]
MNRITPTVVLTTLALVLSAHGQPAKPLCSTWQWPQLSEPFTADFVPMLHGLWRSVHAEISHACLTTGALAGKAAAYQLRDAPWIVGQGSNVLISLRSIGHEYPVHPVTGVPQNNNCGPWPTLPDEDDRAFFREADKLSGYTGDDAHSNKHPFLINAPRAGRCVRG